MRTTRNAASKRCAGIRVAGVLAIGANIAASAQTVTVNFLNALGATISLDTAFFTPKCLDGSDMKIPHAPE